MRRKTLISMQILLFAIITIALTNCRKIEEDAPVVKISPEIIELGADKTTDKFTIANTGTGSITFAAKPTEDWITVSPTGGTTSGSNETKITVTIDKTNLTANDYTGKVIMELVELNNQEVTVSMTVLEANTPPTARFSIDNTTNYTNTDFVFDASDSEDTQTQTDLLKVVWDFGDGNGFSSVWTTDKTITHNYSTAGTKTVRLKVKDIEGLESDIEEHQITVNAPGKPIVNATAPTNINHNSAELMGEIANMGNGAASILNYGFCWSATNHVPTITDSHQDFGTTTLDNQTHNYSHLITGLDAEKQYFFRAYAYNTIGDENIAYSSAVDFKTTMPQAPYVVSTGSVTNIASYSAVVAGTLNNIGIGVTIEKHGHCWSKNENPTIGASNTTTDLGAITAVGNFSSDITVDTEGTLYYVRAYIKSGGVVSYGNQVKFTSLQ